MRFFILLFAMAVSVQAQNWNQFRGPSGRGHAGEVEAPVRWSADNLAWRVDLKGTGQSSPVNWGDRLFLTSAVDEGRTRLVMCLDRKTGRLLWEREVTCDTPETPHDMNSWATPTCATDGERVVAFFGPAGLHCYDLDGKHLWSKSLGEFPGPWGVAASPIILDDLIIQNGDAQRPSFLVALNKHTGEEVWRTPRQEKPRGGWSTPTLIDLGSRRELLLNGEFGVHAYDPETGKDLWFCKGFTGRGTPVPEYAHGLVIVVNGKVGDAYAVKPGGSGDVTSERMVWHTPRKGGRDLPGPVVVGDYLFVVSMSGIATMYNARTGELLWTERLEGAFSAPPLEANGLIYMLDESGLTYVIKPADKLEIVSRNSLGDRADEIFRAAISPIGGQLFLRSTSALYCID